MNTIDNPVKTLMYLETSYMLLKDKLRHIKNFKSSNPFNRTVPNQNWVGVLHHRSQRKHFYRKEAKQSKNII